jgi:hypothetical protein
METHRAGTAAGDAPFGAVVQPCSGDLERFADCPPARRLAVLEADAELVTGLMLRGYAGRPWAKFANALAEYAVEVLRAWIASGAIFAKCRAKGVRGLGALQLHARDDDDAIEIAGMTVAVALVAFREKVLIPGRWRPDRGASLKTFFIGQCLFQFPDAYRQWAREMHGVPLDLQANVGDLALVHPPAAPTSVVAELRRHLRVLAHDEAPALNVMVEMGFSHNEIAATTGQTPKAVELKIYRLRKAANGT